MEGDLLESASLLRTVALQVVPHSTSAHLSSSLPPAPSLPVASSVSASAPSRPHPAPSSTVDSVPRLSCYTSSSGRHSIHPGWSPETGLPMEIWIEVFNILYQSHSATTLLACALTCSYLRGPAQSLLTSLFCRLIRSWTYEDIDAFVDDVRTAPRDVKLVSKVMFVPKDLKRGDIPPQSSVALSVAPVRLAGQRILTNIRILELREHSYPTGSHFHPLSCPLYGRAFPNVTHLFIGRFQFPSFIDFAFFVTSFRALTFINVTDVSCRIRKCLPVLQEDRRNAIYG